MDKKVHKTLRRNEKSPELVPESLFVKEIGLEH